MDINKLTNNSISIQEIEEIVALFKKLDARGKELVLASIRGAVLIADYYRKGA
jgi:hypothetical protein